MNKSDLVNELSMKMGVPHCQSREFLNAFQAILSEKLKNEEIVLQGFGTLAPWAQAERMGRNPRTGEMVMIRPRTSVKFKPGKFLLETLNPEKR